MKRVTDLVRLLLIFGWFAAPFTCAGAEVGGFCLKAEVNGSFVPVVAVRSSRLICREAAGDSIHDFAREFRLVGDPKTMASAFCWAPHYQLIRPGVADRVPPQQRGWIGIVRVAHQLPGRMFPPPVSFFDHWPNVSGKPGLMVVGWIVDGQISKFHVETLAPEKNRLLDVGHVFQLTEAEAKGRAFVLFWADGNFVQPVTAIKDAAVSFARSAMMLGDPAPLAVLLREKGRSVISEKIRNELLMLAIDGGISTAVELLLGQDAPLRFSNDLRRSLLVAGAFHGRAEALVALSDRIGLAGIERGMTAATAALMGHEQAAQKILASGSAVDRHALEAVLFSALYAGHVDLAKEATKRGAKFGLSPRQAGAVLVDQARMGRTGMVRWMLDRGVDPNMSYAGETALGAAATRGDMQTIDALLQAGANLDLMNENNVTPLIAACIAGQTAVANVLLDKGADVRRQSLDGKTALLAAVEWGEVKLVEEILNRGANFSSVGAGGIQPLAIALGAGSTETARLLARRGAKIDLSASDANSLLELAISVDVPELVQAALEDGWSAESEFHGLSAFGVAQVNGASGCMAVLRAKLPKQSFSWPQVFDVVAVSTVPEVISAPKPSDLRAYGMGTGKKTVYVEFLVSDVGAVLFPRITATDDPQLSAPVLATIRQWKFKPATLAGNAVHVRAALPIVFDEDLEREFSVHALDAPPAVSGIADFGSKWRGKDLFKSPLEFVVGRNGVVEETEFRVARPSVEAEAVRKEIRWTIFTPGIISGRLVKSRVVLPAVFASD